MKNIFKVLFVLFFVNCSKTKDLNDIIKLNMSYNEVKSILGKPTDSIRYKNADNLYIIKLRYDNVENFSDYGFNVIFNDSLKVIDKHYD